MLNYLFMPNASFTKDPFLKPVILSALLTVLLSLIFALGLILWAIIGGYVAVRLAYKTTKETISLIDCLLLGLFSGIVGATCLDMLTIVSFSSHDNQALLIRTMEKNWPKDIQAPDFNTMLPSIFFTTCVIIFLITVASSVLGSYIGIFLSKKKDKRKIERLE